ncbi:MAG: RecX family transcriptional regulator [Patescibacteria group bacterium]
MPKITSITAQKNQKRVNINLDGVFGFGLDLENFIKLQLKVYQELSQEEVDEIIKKGEFQKCLDKVINFAMVRPRSEREIKDYYRRKKTAESIQEELTNKLKKLELLDDIKFAQWWVEQRLQFKNKSKKDITFELRQKGIDSNTIKNILDDSEIDEVKIAKELIFKKLYKWKKYDEKEKKQKISQYLAGKGFGWNVVNDVLK